MLTREFKIKIVESLMEIKRVGARFLRGVTPFQGNLEIVVSSNDEIKEAEELIKSKLNENMVTLDVSQLLEIKNKNFDKFLDNYLSIVKECEKKDCGFLYFKDYCNFPFEYRQRFGCLFKDQTIWDKHGSLVRKDIKFAGSIIIRTKDSPFQFIHADEYDFFYTIEE